MSPCYRQHDRGAPTKEIPETDSILMSQQEEESGSAWAACVLRAWARTGFDCFTPGWGRCAGSSKKKKKKLQRNRFALNDAVNQWVFHRWEPRASSLSGTCRRAAAAPASLHCTRCPDLTETQPDAHKYAPLFLPSRAFQLGGFVLGVPAAPPHVAHGWERERRREGIPSSWATCSLNGCCATRRLPEQRLPPSVPTPSNLVAALKRGSERQSGASNAG